MLRSNIWFCMTKVVLSVSTIKMTDRRIGWKREVEFIWTSLTHNTSWIKWYVDVYNVYLIIWTVRKEFERRIPSDWRWLFTFNLNGSFEYDEILLLTKLILHVCYICDNLNIQMKEKEVPRYVSQSLKSSKMSLIKDCMHKNKKRILSESKENEGGLQTTLSIVQFIPYFNLA